MQFLKGKENYEFFGVMWQGEAVLCRKELFLFLFFSSVDLTPTFYISNQFSLLFVTDKVSSLFAKFTQS